MKSLIVPYLNFSGRLSLTKSVKEALLKFMFLPYFFNGPSMRKVGERMSAVSDFSARQIGLRWCSSLVMISFLLLKI